MTYVDDALDVVGNPVQITKTATRGDLVTFSARECARLDALGVLCAAGTSIEQMEANSAAVVKAYRDARQSIADVGSGF